VAPETVPPPDLERGDSSLSLTKNGKEDSLNSLREESMKKNLVLLYSLAIAASLTLLAIQVSCFGSASADKEIVSSRSYSGHENDQDSNNFVQAYPSARATRLDDCQLCHRAGARNASGTKVVSNVCSHCHLIEWPDATYTVDHPATFADTLNAYGIAYKNAGRTKAAIKAIADDDSDGDGSTNAVEIADNRFPGNAASKPGQPYATVKTITKAQIRAMTTHSQFMLMNTTKQQYDDYATYYGVKVSDFLAAASIDMTAATSITVFAPDGFSKDHPKADDASALTYDIESDYENGTYYRTSEIYDNANPLLNCVNYPAVLPSYAHLEEITDDLSLMIAYRRDGVDLTKSYYDGTTGRLEGEGPYRLITPQNVASRPDRGSTYTQAAPDDGYNYLSTLDHNAGSSTRGVCVIRINPMPAGVEEFDYTNGWSLIENASIVIYGEGVD
jgi:hypothetical protein